MIAQERVVTRQAWYEQKVKTTEVVIKIGWTLERVPAESGVLGSVQHRNQLGSLQYAC